MNLCEIPCLVLMKILRYLDVPAISKTLQANRFLCETIHGERRRLPKRQVLMIISGNQDRYIVSVRKSPSSFGHLYKFFVCHSHEKKLEMMNEEKEQSSDTTAFFFRPAEECLKNFGDIVTKLLETRDLKGFLIMNTTEGILHKISIALQSNNSIVHTLIMDQDTFICPSSLCELIHSTNGVESLNLSIMTESMSKELFKIPQIIAATDIVIRNCNSKEVRLSLTDADILALSAKSISLSCQCDYSPRFITKFVQEFLSGKRMISSRPIFSLNNSFRLDTRDLNPEEMFAGMRCRFSSSNKRSGTITRDDGLVLYFNFTSTRFEYRLIDG